MFASLWMFAACGVTSGDTALDTPLAAGTARSLASPSDSSDTGASAHNFIVVVLDDVGVDKIAAYGEHDDPATTPVIDALADEGVLFRNAWAMPMCSPSRAALMTGRYPTRTGIGYAIDGAMNEVGLRADEVTLPDILSTHYATAAVGKWHLTTFGDGLAAEHPLSEGFDHHRGPLGNPEDSASIPRVPTDYDSWERNEDGVLDYSTDYLTSATVDDAIELVDELEEPYFLWVAFNAPHSPYHEPPAGLHTQELDASSTDGELYDAMLEAADTELGRLLDELDPDVRARTTIVVMGDNGTPGNAVVAPWDGGRSKATLYDGGVRVPLIVASPEVGTPGSETDAFVSVVDLLPTLTELAGMDVGALERAPGVALELDGQSFVEWIRHPDTVSGRGYLFAEQFRPNGPGPYDFVNRSLRIGDYKLVRERIGSATSDALYRYDEGAIDEGVDLLTGPLTSEDSAALDELQVRLTGLVGDLRR